MPVLSILFFEPRGCLPHNIFVRNKPAIARILLGGLQFLPEIKPVYQLINIHFLRQIVDHIKHLLSGYGHGNLHS
jgi:hypothetical protein